MAQTSNRTMLISKLARQFRNNELGWRYTFNLKPTLLYAIDRKSVGVEGRRILYDLNRDGIAKTSVSRLLEDTSSYDELVSTVERIEIDLSEDLDAARAQVDNSGEVGSKTFMLELLGRYPTLDPQCVFARFALQPAILQIANAYFGMYTRLRYYNVWHTIASGSPARESQLWHRDREDYLILKMFLYLSDVDEGAGPFTYAKGTHPKGNRRQEAEYFLEGNVKRSTDEQMSAAAAPASWIKGIGPKGTIIFADTRGYHKGGLARERDRLMYTCMFTSQASQSQEFLRRTTTTPSPSDRKIAFALASNQIR
jgi:hypothetical protein